MYVDHYYRACCLLCREKCGLMVVFITRIDFHCPKTGIIVQQFTFEWSRTYYLQQYFIFFFSKYNRHHLQSIYLLFNWILDLLVLTTKHFFMDWWAIYLSKLLIYASYLCHSIIGTKNENHLTNLMNSFKVVLNALLKWSIIRWRASPFHLEKVNLEFYDC